jgi:NTE family protein
MVRSRARQKQPLALLDNGPLGELLAEIVQFNRIEDAIARGELEGIGVTAMNYSNGRSTTFYQGQAHLQPWTRAQRRSIACQLTVNHLMASAALPTLFPAVKLGDHYFGDGALRQSRPLSPAIHLGADRLFIIGVSQQHGNFTPEPEAKSAPTIPNVLGQMLNAVFLDSVQTDLETLRRINALVTQMNSKQLTAAGMSDMRVIDTLTISPSRSLDELARDHIHELPRTMRWFLERTGSIKDAGSGGALSYVLFEQGYCQQLMQLGYEDAMAQADEVRRFFDMTPLNAAEAAAQATPEKHKMTTINGLTRRWLKLLGRA